MKDGSQTTPTQPSQTEVKTAEAHGASSPMTRHQKPSMERMPTLSVPGIHPAPTVTHKAVHEFVSGTPGKELPQEVKTLLPADQTDLKDGSQAAPTQPSQTEVKTAEGTWSFRSL